MRPTIAVTIFIVLNSAAPAPAEPNHLPKIDPRGRVLNGRRLEGKVFPFAESVVAIRNGRGTCTGLVVEGCILSAAHCKGDDMSVFEGTDLGSAKRSKALGRIGAFRIKGTGKGINDIAIFKTRRKIRSEISQPLSVLSKDAYEGTKDESLLDVIGFGISETREHFDEEAGETNRVNFGSGVKRHGQLTYGGKEGELLTHTRFKTAQMTAAGDSGAPLFVKKAGGAIRVVAVLSAGRAHRLDGESKEDSRENDDVTGLSVPISKHYAWIKETLKLLDCAPGDPKADSLEVFVRKEFAPLKDADKAWDKDEKWQAGARKLKELKAKVVEELQASGDLKAPFTHVSLTVKFRGGKLKIEWSGKLSEGNDDALFLKAATERGALARPNGTIEFPEE